MHPSFRWVVGVAALLCAVALTPSSRTKADTPNDGDVDKYIAGVMQERHIPGLSLAVLREGKVIKQKGYGLANVELEVPASAETVYQLASNTKNFAGAAAMLLVQEQKLSLDDKVSKHLGGLPATWSEITVRQIATHTSGLPDLMKNQYSTEVVADTQGEVLKELAGMPFSGKPGDVWIYNQTNYLLLKMIIEKLAGMPFEQFVTERFFQPFGMTSTTFGDCREVVKGRASIYTRLQIKNGRLVPPTDRIWNFSGYVYPDYMHTAAGLNSTVLDLAKWDAALWEAKVLKAPALEQMWTAVKFNNGKVFRSDGKHLGYGIGWLVSDRPGHRFVGGSGGASTAYARFLDDKLTVIVLTNLQGCNPDSIVDGVAQFYIPGLAAVGK
jgi:D-alanyl-D-alanine carboxypeptidase